MKVIVITLPDAGVENEAARIIAMLESGVIDRVHIRKPGMSASEMRMLISGIPLLLHSRLSIHSNPELLLEFSGVGWHFSDTRPADPFEAFGGIYLLPRVDAQRTVLTTLETRAGTHAEHALLRSRSCHSPAEVLEWAERCDYVMLSPVFDSISKPGYLSACFNPVEEFLCCQSGNVVALGGVTPERFPRLKERGYYGAAMLGYAWKTDLTQLMEELKCYNS